MCFACKLINALYFSTKPFFYIASNFKAPVVLLLYNGKLFFLVLLLEIIQKAKSLCVPLRVCSSGELLARSVKSNADGYLRFGSV